MEGTNTPTTPEKYNAIMSYCFLAGFVLLSKNEKFQSPFVRIHARYAFLIQILFLILILILIQSRNFSSIILFGASWVHIILFVCFGILLIFLGVGIYSALLGINPKIHIHEFSWSSMKNLSQEVEVSEEQKTPIILAHIPFFGTYLRQKYGDFLSEGEKFGNWFWVIEAALLWLDPSFIFPIVWLFLGIFWIVYQSILIYGGDNMRLIGTKLSGSHEVHILIRSIYQYARKLINKTGSLPLWSDIISLEVSKYIGTKNLPQKLTLPLINVPFLWKNWKNTEQKKPYIEAILINTLFVYAFVAGHIPLLLVLILGVWASYWQGKKNQDISLPLLGEISEGIEKILIWGKKKSIPEEIKFTNTNQ